MATPEAGESVLFDIGYTPNELAACLAVTPAVIRQWAHRGFIQPIARRGRVTLYNGVEVRRVYLERQLKRAA